MRGLSIHQWRAMDPLISWDKDVSAHRDRRDLHFFALIWTTRIFHINFKAYFRQIMIVFFKVVCCKSIKSTLVSGHIFNIFQPYGMRFHLENAACTAPIIGPAGPAPAVREDGAARGFYSELDPEKLMVKTLGVEIQSCWLGWLNIWKDKRCVQPP